ncbi:PREDICTED: uncharacterized protein LOC104816135 [Tarenaya hassleriana]|uniref:uncharacterized protein LOC104816135 n=1 Tax=Tarenaya hassleriana TaxID=28532 RepID=UPI00053C5B27|nr:PREDICTED: uncharacterized protein LOC104816135 [Tarenaya hassleriana]
MRNELRVFQEAMMQTLRAHIPPPPPAGGPEPRGEDLPPPPPVDPMAGEYLPIIRELRAMHTPRFEGSLSPKTAEEWLTTITRDLEYVQCPHRHRATIASHHLAGQARHWWKKVVQEMPEGHRFTWEEFKGEFEHKYYNHQDQEHRFTEFLQLQQGNMTAERGEKEEKEERIRDRSPIRRFSNAQPPGKTSQTGQSSQSRGKGKAPADGVLPLPPPPYRGPLTCFRCQQPGHCAATCTAPTDTLPMARQPRPPPRAGAVPRVYALEAEAEAQEEETNLGEDEALHLCDVECYTLFDTGATHSFLSLDTKSDFTVRTPSGETLPVHGTLRDVSLDICGRNLAADLIVVPIGGHSIILGMDWLSKHRAQIDCQKRTI